MKTNLRIPSIFMRAMLLCLVIAISFLDETLAQTEGTREQVLRVMFWNVENLFYPGNDPATQDDEFTPNGARRWTFKRMYDKMQHLAQVVVAAGDGEVPALLGLAEVEDDSVMLALTRNAAFGRLDYEYVMTHSDDVRGIDVALCYQSHQFALIDYESVRVPMPEDKRPTRDVLHVWGRTIYGDTLDVVVCHLPSRLGGVKESMSSRMAAHSVIHKMMQKVMNTRVKPMLIVMGDMNDYPNTKLLLSDLELHDPLDSVVDNFVYDMMIPLHRQLIKGELSTGTHKYDGEWGFLDHFLVNGAMLHGSINHVRVFSAPFMLVEDKSHIGVRPKRSYYGFKYENGYSDHLPILLDLHIK